MKIVEKYGKNNSFVICLEDYYGSGLPLLVFSLAKQ